jgi:hypothetical protein
LFRSSTLFQTLTDQEKWDHSYLLEISLNCDMRVWTYVLPRKRKQSFLEVSDMQILPVGGRG